MRAPEALTPSWLTVLLGCCYCFAVWGAALDGGCPPRSRGEGDAEPHG